MLDPGSQDAGQQHVVYFQVCLIIIMENMLDSDGCMLRYIERCSGSSPFLIFCVV